MTEGLYVRIDTPLTDRTGDGMVTSSSLAS